MKTDRLGLFWLLWNFCEHFDLCVKDCIIWGIVMQKSSENVNRQQSC